MECAVYVSFAVFGLIFIAYVFIRSYIDNKKEKAVMTEIFRKYGVKTDAKILSAKENQSYGRHGIQGRYNYQIEFQYNSLKGRTMTRTYTLPTNHPDSKKYTETIPIIYIPAYLDYDTELISRKEFFSSIGHKLRLGYDCRLVIFAEDLSIFTNLTEL